MSGLKLRTGLAVQSSVLLEPEAAQLMMGFYFSLKNSGLLVTSTAVAMRFHF